MDSRFCYGQQILQVIESISLKYRLGGYGYPLTLSGIVSPGTLGLLEPCQHSSEAASLFFMSHTKKNLKHMKAMMLLL